ncbi:MAG: VC0807 family protein [Opitutales bacterium]
MNNATPKPKPENLLLNLVCNVGLPTLILSYGSGAKALGPKGGLVVALAFPIGYGLHDFARRRRFNFISIIGFVSVLVSGGFGLMKLDGFWFAVKDAALPGLIGVAVLASMRAKEPLVHEILYNPQVIDVARVDAALTARGTQGAFLRLMDTSSYLLALSFGLSGVLNYFLARYLLVSPPGTEAFNAELAKMHLWNWPVIVLPSMAMMLYALWRLLKGLEVLTGLTFDEIMHQGAAGAAPEARAAANQDKTGNP